MLFQEQTNAQKGVAVECAASVSVAACMSHGSKNAKLLALIRSPRLQIHDLPLVWFPRVLHVLQSANHSSKKRKARQLERACNTKLYTLFTPQSFSVFRTYYVQKRFIRSLFSVQFEHVGQRGESNLAQALKHKKLDFKTSLRPLLLQMWYRFYPYPGPTPTLKKNTPSTYRLESRLYHSRFPWASQRLPAKMHLAVFMITNTLIEAKWSSPLKQSTATGNLANKKFARCKRACLSGGT